jgi:hypothetical protein
MRLYSPLLIPLSPPITFLAASQVVSETPEIARFSAFQFQLRTDSICAGDGDFTKQARKAY